MITNKINPIIAILAAWLLVNGINFFQYGIVTSGEAIAYVFHAHLIQETGHLRSPSLWLYSVTIFLLAFLVKFHLSYGFMVGFQLLVNLLVTLYFYQTVREMTTSVRTALVATLILLFALPYQAFNFFLQTESLFQSLSLLLVCYLIRRPAFSWSTLAVLIGGIALLSLTRPNGILYWPLITIYLLQTRPKNSPLLPRLLAGSAFLLLFLLLLSIAMNSGGDLDFQLPFNREHIICGCPTTNTNAPIDTVTGKGALYTLLYYVFHNPGHFARLAVLKSVSFWGIGRRYYSPLHNAYLNIYFYPLILMAVLSIRRHLKTPRPFWYLLTPVMLTWFTVILTCDDWSNRIFFSIFPFILLLATPFLKRPHI